MKRIVFATYGSRGDVQPMLVLAMELNKRGFATLLCAPPEQRGWVESYGVSFEALGSNAKEFVEQNPDPTLSNIKSLIRFFRREILIQHEQLPKYFEGADFVIRSGITTGASAILESMNLPSCLIAMTPQVIPSGKYSSPWLPFQNLPPFLNLFGWWLSDRFTNFIFKKIADKERQHLGLGPVKNFWRDITGDNIIIATDPLLGTPPVVEGIKSTQTGYLHLDQTGELDGKLLEFLDAGDPPVFVGFGSMVSSDPEKTFRTVVHAARENGRRLILSTGWKGMTGDAEDDDIYITGEAPHPLLFPKMSVIIHHGGAGTTATAARAGIPQVIVPHMTDQFFWGEQVYKTGLGPKPIFRSRLTAGRLAKAIDTATTNGHIIRRSSAMALALKATNAIGDTIDYIEREFLGNSNSPVNI